MTPEQIAEQEAATAAANAEAEKAKAALSHDPLEGEVKKIKKETTRTELEKAQFSLRKNAEKVKELGGNPDEILGGSMIAEDDDKPVTVKMLKELEAKKAQKTALQLAEDIKDENERELVKHYLETKVIPSGNAEEDLRFAQAGVNAKRNALIAEESGRKSGANAHVSAPGAPAKNEGEIFEPTPEEATYMRPPFNLTQAQIVAARK